jgi:hypothetical protein
MAFASDDTKDGVRFTGARTANTITFVLLGGKYAWSMTAASTSSELDIQMPDGSYQPAATALTTSAAYTVVDLAPGTYRIVMVATSDVAGFVQKIPYAQAH